MRTRGGMTRLVVAAVLGVLMFALAGCVRQEKPSLPRGHDRVGSLEVSATIASGKLAGRDDPRSWAIWRTEIAPGEAAYTLVVSALNTSEQTVSVPVERNDPALIAPDGGTLKRTFVASNVCSGALVQPYRGAYALGPHLALRSFQTYSLPPSPHDYVVRWNLGKSGTAELEVP